MEPPASARCGDGRRRRSSADNHEDREAGELKRQPGPEDAERVVGETQQSDTQLRQGPRRSWPGRRAVPSGANEAGEPRKKHGHADQQEPSADVGSADSITQGPQPRADRDDIRARQRGKGAKTVERAATVARRRPGGDGASPLDGRALASEVGGTGTRAGSFVDAQEQRPRLGSSSACSFQRATGTSSAPAEKSRRASASSGTGASS